MTSPLGPSGSEPIPESAHASLRGLYANLDADLAGLGPTCRLSGHCCRFTAYGHTLFVSALEAALLLADAPPPVRPLDDGATCPWQDGLGRCTAREARPLGCRVYFCDPRFQEVLPELGERFVVRLKRIVDEAGLRWDYAPLHRHLHAAREAGSFPPESVPTGRAETPARGEHGPIST